ncbi:hypothetical protein GGF31_007212 [Allomyces arbusculus]|nr:hypothetical protein GGF31_007212 [Allomyces arbusculus]
MTPCFPSTLNLLNLSHNKLYTLFAPFPPKLQVIDFSFNCALSEDASPVLWMDALPSSLRTLDIRSCRIDEDVGALILALRKRMGMTAAGMAKLRIVTGSRLGDRDDKSEDIAFNRFDRRTYMALMSAEPSSRPQRG